MKSYLLVLMMVFISSAEASSKKILVSVGDLLRPNELSWKKETCRQIHALANQIIFGGVDVTCRSFSTSSFADYELLELSSSYDYHLKLIRDYEGNLGLDATNWNKELKSDFSQLGWDFHDGKSKKITKEDAFIKTLGNFFYYVGNEEAFKTGLLLNGIHESHEVEFDEKEKVFRKKSSQEMISPKKAYMIFENESERKANFLRTGIEIGVLLSAGMAIYYKNLVYNKQDFDYGFKDGLEAKFKGDALLFEDNDKYANYGHVYAGDLYYKVARANGFNSLESFLIGFASSATWEILEYHEVFSLNDQIMTPIGGYVLGEAGYQISCALLQKNSLFGKAIGYSLTPSLAATHLMDRNSAGGKYSSQPDCKEKRWSKISAYIGLDKGQKAYQPTKDLDSLVGLEAEVVTIKDYGKEGKAQHLVYDTAMVKAIAERNGNEGLSDLKIIAQVVTAAYRQKSISKDDKGELQGYDIMLGLGSASTWNDNGRGKKSDDEDFYGTINILGTTAHANLFYKGYNIRADFSIYGDFTMVKSYALANFRDSRGKDLSDQSGVLQKRGYNWGTGTTALAAISIEKGRFEVGYKGQLSNSKSFDERQRIEAKSDDEYRDRISTNRYFVKFKISKNLSVQIARDYNSRVGTVNRGYTAKGKERRIIGTLVYDF